MQRSLKINFYRDLWKIFFVMSGSMIFAGCDSSLTSSIPDLQISGFSLKYDVKENGIQSDPKVCSIIEVYNDIRATGATAYNSSDISTSIFGGTYRYDITEEGGLAVGASSGILVEDHYKGESGANFIWSGPDTISVDYSDGAPKATNSTFNFVTESMTVRFHSCAGICDDHYKDFPDQTITLNLNCGKNYTLTLSNQL